MAVTLEDELAAEAAERERARLEEEALIAASQPPIWAGSAAADIDAFNAGPPIAVTAPTQIGSTQYQQELARAQAGSGFIAPDISPTGEVITPGYDPTRDFARIKSEEAAMRYKGQQLYQSLVSGGATPAEAYRAAGHLLNFSNPLAQVKAEDLISRRAFQPRSVMGEGVTFDELSPGRFSRRPPPRMPAMVPGRVPPAVRAAEDNLKDQISALRGQLARGGVMGVPLPAAEADALRAEIAKKERERVELLSAPEMNPNIDQAGWMNMRDRFNAAPRPPTDDKVVVIKDGKRYRLPKSQLAEATKEGYKLAE